jgi:hypothetical protein
VGLAAAEKFATHRQVIEVKANPNELRNFPPPTPGGIIGLGWLHALHARTCIRQNPSAASRIIVDFEVPGEHNVGQTSL